MLAEELQATIQTEEALLGAILVESAGTGTREAIINSSTIIQPSDFIGYAQKSQHARIYQAMLSCKTAPHQIAVAEELNNLHLLGKGDCGYLCYLVSRTPCSLDYLDYANTVVNYSIERNPQRKLTKKNIYQGLQL